MYQCINLTVLGILFNFKEKGEIYSNVISQIALY